MGFIRAAKRAGAISRVVFYRSQTEDTYRYKPPDTQVVSHVIWSTPPRPLQGLHVNLSANILSCFPIASIINPTLTDYSCYDRKCDKIFRVVLRTSLYAEHFRKISFLRQDFSGENFGDRLISPRFPTDTKKGSSKTKDAFH